VLLTDGVPAPTTAFLPWVLGVNVLSVAVVAAYRHSEAPERAEAFAGEGSGSYLQKLFAVRGTARPKKAAASAGPAEMADFELGKMLHSWEGGAVHWARQKSLDRAVLVWRDSTPVAGAVPGVVVRHPAVLNLHAICPCPGGRLLVTEPVAASPLAEVLSQRPLTSREATALAARVAEAVQAFHDQGACHGRLGPEWVLVHGDLEPALCPCGVPSRSPADRAADLRALGALLESWLPPRSVFWRYETLAYVYRACDAAKAGGYERAADFAADLDRAGRAGQVRWRGRWATAVVVLLLVLPWLVLPLRWLLGRGDGTDPDLPRLLSVALVALCPAALLFGYAQIRALLLRHRLRASGHDRIFSRGPWKWLGQAGAFAAMALALGALGLFDETHGLRALPALALVLLGFWGAGASAAGMVTFTEFLVRSLRREQPAAPVSAAQDPAP
jgi:hypothetical protein